MNTGSACLLPASAIRSLYGKRHDQLCLYKIAIGGVLRRGHHQRLEVSGRRHRSRHGYRNRLRRIRGTSCEPSRETDNSTQHHARRTASPNSNGVRKKASIANAVSNTASSAYQVLWDSWARLAQLVCSSASGIKLSRDGTARNLNRDVKARIRSRHAGNHGGRRCAVGEDAGGAHRQIAARQYKRHRRIRAARRGSGQVYRCRNCCRAR